MERAGQGTETIEATHEDKAAPEKSQLQSEATKFTRSPTCKTAGDFEYTNNSVLNCSSSVARTTVFEILSGYRQADLHAHGDSTREGNREHVST